MSLAKTGTIRQLKMLNTIARVGSVSVAAREVHLTQSAASLQIGALELAVGAELLLRTGRGVRLTEAGELLNRYADRVLALWQEASEELESLQGAFSGTLNIGAVTTVEYWLPHLLVAFVRANPRVRLKLRIGNREEVVRDLSTHRIDLAIMGTPPEELQVVSATFAKNPMAFVAAPHHWSMQCERLELAALAEADLLVRERGSGSRTMVDRLFREAGLQLRIGSEMSSYGSLKQMCAAGFGPAFLSLHTCVLEIRAGLLKVLSLPGYPIEREWFVVRIASKEVLQVVLAFEAFLCTEGKDQIAALVDLDAS